MSGTDALSRHEELNKTTYSHQILVRGESFAFCKARVLKFFDRYQLVRYSVVSIKGNEAVCASAPAFGTRLSEVIGKNRTILRGMIEELQKEDVTTLDDLERLPQGYKSKLLHIITHFLDGFFGIDTFFYNLEEDSHWVSDQLMKKIGSEPSLYWLLSVEGEP